MGLYTFLQVSGFFSKSLYRSDGTESGTFSVDSVNLRTGANITDLTSVGDSVFYSAIVSVSSLFPSRLFKIDNNTNNPVLIQQNPESGGGFAGSLKAVGNTLFFADNINSFEEGSIDRELWKSDGTDAGTVLVKDINGIDSSNPNLLADLNGTLFFTADDGTNGRELWKSNGTNSGTVLIKDINPGSASSISPTPFTSPTSNSGNKFLDVNGTFYFVADDGINGNELWKSDGTQAGTVLVEDITPGSEGSNLDNLINVNCTLFFTVNNGSNRTELWKSNGTAKGTVLVGDINPGSASSNPGSLTNFDGELYFSADDGVNGRELWGLTETNINNGLILGGSSNDVLSGNDQDNIFDGLKGDDTLTGGAGKDKFVLSSEFGNDVITDFTLGEDEIINTTDNIVLTVGCFGDSLKVAFSNTGDVLQVNLNGNDRAGLENYLLNIGSDRALPY